MRITNKQRYATDKQDDDDDNDNDDRQIGV